MIELYRNDSSKDYPRSAVRPRHPGRGRPGSSRCSRRTFARTRRRRSRSATSRSLGEIVSSISPTRVTSKSGDADKAHTLVWGAGLQANPIVTSLGIELEKGHRVHVEPDLSSRGIPRSWSSATPPGSSTRTPTRRFRSSARSRSSPARRQARTSRAASTARTRSRSTTRTRARWRRSAARRRSSSSSTGEDAQGQEGVARVGRRAPRAPLDRRGPGEGRDRLDLGRLHTRARGTHRRGHQRGRSWRPVPVTTVESAR